MENTVLLQNIFLFRNLGRLDLINVNKLVHAQRYEKGAVIIREGQVPDHMYIVKTGSVYVYIEGAAGKKEVLATLAPGDHFGEMALIDSQPRSANVEAAEDCECLYISANEFRRLMDSDINLKLHFYEAFLRTLCQRLRSTNDAAVVYRMQADMQLG